MNRSHAFAIIAALILLVLAYLLVFDASKVFNQQREDDIRHQHNDFYANMKKVDHSNSVKINDDEEEEIQEEEISNEIKDGITTSSEASTPTTTQISTTESTASTTATTSETTSETTSKLPDDWTTTTNPGINFITLQDRPDLGIEFYPRANVISDQNRYAIIVANEMIPKGSVQYTFNIPVTCMAWMQIGYGCFIVMPYFEHHAVRFLKKKSLNVSIICYPK